MKNLSLLFSFVVVVVLFSVTMSVSFAQTSTLTQSDTVNINSVQSKPTSEVTEKTPAPTLYRNIESVTTTNVEGAVPTATPYEYTESTRDNDTEKVGPIPTLYETKRIRDIDVKKTDGGYTDKPRSFLEKARETLQLKRIETAGSRDIRLQTDREEVTNKLRTEERAVNNIREEKRDASRAQIEERVSAKEERIEKEAVQRKERINKFLNNINRKMDAAIDRLDTLLGRIESRIVKFEERGIDMTEVRQHLEIANNNIRSAVESISTADANAREALAGDPSRDTFGNVVSELNGTKESLRSAHASLVKAISAMKASISGEKQERDKGKEETLSPDENDTGAGETN